MSVAARRLAGRVAVITGSGRTAGLGAAIARRLAAEGASVVISDQGEAARSSEIAAVVASARSAGAAASFCACDVTSYQQVCVLADHAITTHGRLDIWVNNAGIGNVMKPLLEVTPEDWGAVIDVNLTGAFYGLRAAAERMVARGAGGRIVNIASQAAKSGFAHAQAYTASKHGLVGLVRSAAIELGKFGITVNNVCPNHVTTDLGTWQNEYFSRATGYTSVESYLAAMAQRIPLRRAGLPEDTAAAVAFLCSDDACYITAESMNVSGGEEPH